MRKLIKNKKGLQLRFFMYGIIIMSMLFIAIAAILASMNSHYTGKTQADTALIDAYGDSFLYDYYTESGSAKNKVEGGTDPADTVTGYSLGGAINIINLVIKSITAPKDIMIDIREDNQIFIPNWVFYGVIALLTFALVFAFVSVLLKKDL